MTLERLRGLTDEGKKVVRVSVSGPTSYSSPIYVRASYLQSIDDVYDVEIDGGFKAEPALTGGFPVITGNQVAVKVYYQTGVSGYPLTEVASGHDLSARMITAVVIGW